MPSLPAALQGQADEAAETGGSFLLEPGVYTGRLKEVKATQSNNKNPMWALEFDEIRDLDGRNRPGRQWTNLVLIDSVMWKVGMFYAAFGVPSSVNTDELVNHRCRLQIGQRVAEAGQRAGQLQNEINGFQPLAEGDAGFELVRKLAAKYGGGKVAPPAQAAPAMQKAAPAAQQQDAAPAQVAASAPSGGAQQFAEAGEVDF